MLTLFLQGCSKLLSGFPGVLHFWSLACHGNLVPRTISTIWQWIVVGLALASMAESEGQSRRPPPCATLGRACRVPSPGPHPPTYHPQRSPHRAGRRGLRRLRVHRPPHHPHAAPGPPGHAVRPQPPVLCLLAGVKADAPSSFGLTN